MTSGEVVLLRRHPVKSMGAAPLGAVAVGPSGLVGDREWAVHDSAGKWASGKNSRRFRRMDAVFELVASSDDGVTTVLLPDGRTVVAGEPGTDEVLSGYFGEQVRLCRADVPHHDAAPVSIVGTATLAALGSHEGDRRPLDPLHLRANIVVETDEPYAEDAWCGGTLTIGGVRLAVREPIVRCRMVGVAQVGLPERPGMLKAISEHHGLLAGIYADVLGPGEIRCGDLVTS